MLFEPAYMLFEPAIIVIGSTLDYILPFPFFLLLQMGEGFELILNVDRMSSPHIGTGVPPIWWLTAHCQPAGLRREALSETGVPP